MEDRRPENPMELTVQDRDENNNLTGDWRYVSDAEVVAYVRRGVESGTIKGLPLFCVAHWCALTPGEATCSLYQRVEGMDACSVEARILVIPVSDGGSET